MGIKYSIINKIVLITFCSVMSLNSFSQKKMNLIEVTALYNKAVAYMDKKDYINSHKYFQKLLPYVPTEAGFYLGEHYYYGLGVKANIEEAIRYYTIAANEGEPISQQKLGIYYFGNELDIREKSLAYHWNKTASNNPDAVDCDDAGECTYNLALC